MGLKTTRAARAAIGGRTAGYPAATGATASAPAPPQGQQSQQKPAPEKARPEKRRKDNPGTRRRSCFASVDQILSFASKDSDLSIRHSVKRRMTNRDEVENYILSKMKDDKDAARLESSEIVLKKFGLLDRDFQLKPFIVSLLTEQIAAITTARPRR